jgi:hypothetical protein
LIAASWRRYLTISSMENSIIHYDLYVAHFRIISEP